MRYFLAISIFLITFSCSTTKNGVTKLDSRCYEQPDPGMCRAAKPRYYYDPVEKKCKMFFWGGCQGLVPFQTLEECMKSCGCDTTKTH